MAFKVACVNCGDFFLPDEQEVFQFIDQNADEKFLKKIPFPQELKRIHKTRRKYIAFLLNAYCPYCRTVLFGPPVEDYQYPGRNIKKCSDKKYAQAIAKEVAGLSDEMNITKLKLTAIILDKVHED